MTIKAEIIEDSIASDYFGPSQKRITTFRVTVPRMVWAEVMTHRVFSRNASSSRAIPIRKMLSSVWKNPAMPVYWGANQAGMQARKELEGFRLWLAKQVWRKSRYAALGIAWTLSKIGLHKQLSNRVLEPWGHITAVITATEYANWFVLRTHPDAQPEIRELAIQMEYLYRTNVPRELGPGDYHLPFITEEERASGMSNADLIKISVARCARTSYFTHDNKPTMIEADVELHDKLIVSQPMHASPAEHQAMPDSWHSLDGWHEPHLHGNLIGFIQYRKTLPGENHHTYN